MVTRAKDR